MFIYTTAKFAPVEINLLKIVEFFVHYTIIDYVLYIGCLKKFAIIIVVLPFSFVLSGCQVINAGRIVLFKFAINWKIDVQCPVIK